VPPVQKLLAPLPGPAAKGASHSGKIPFFKPLQQPLGLILAQTTLLKGTLNGLLPRVDPSGLDSFLHVCPLDTLRLGDLSEGLAVVQPLEKPGRVQSQCLRHGIEDGRPRPAGEPIEESAAESTPAVQTWLAGPVKLLRGPRLYLLQHLLHLLFGQPTGIHRLPQPSLLGGQRGVDDTLGIEAFSPRDLREGLPIP